MANHANASAAKAAMLFGAVGFVAGILLAPKSGKESRQELADKTVALKKRAVSTGERIKDKAQERAKDVKSLASNMAHRASDMASTASEDSAKITKKVIDDSEDIANKARR